MVESIPLACHKSLPASSKCIIANPNPKQPSKIYSALHENPPITFSVSLRYAAHKQPDKRWSKHHVMTPAEMLREHKASRTHWSLGQNFGLGLVTLASAPTFRLWPQGFGFGLQCSASSIWHSSISLASSGKGNTVKLLIEAGSRIRAGSSVQAGSLIQAEFDRVTS